MRQTLRFSVLAISISLASSGCQAPATEGGESDSFAKYGQEFKGKVAKSYQESEEWWPSTPKPPAGTPNVIIFLLDDTGFGHLGSFGGLIDTPNIDRMAENGLRYNNFHTTALCSPSRAAIMAGRNHHRIGLGSHSLTAMGFPGYNAFPPESGKIGCKAPTESRFRELCHRKVGPYTTLRSVREWTL
jgi:arylsulfatase